MQHSFELFNRFFGKLFLKEQTTNDAMRNSEEREIRMTPQVSTRTVFSKVLLEKLTTPGVIYDALSAQPAEHIFFTVAGLAYDRWLDVNKLRESKPLCKSFFRELEDERLRALKIISLQAAIKERCATVH